MAATRVFKIDSERAAWDALSNLLDDKIDADEISLDLSDLSWAKLDVKYSGPDFDQSLNSSAMRGLIEFQDYFYRSVALIKKGDQRITRLSDDEKASFELVFNVGKGSALISADAVKELKELAGSAIDKMTGRQIAMVLIVTVLAFFASAGINHFIDSQIELSRIELEAKKAESEKEEKRLLLSFLNDVMSDRSKDMETLSKIFEKSEYSRQIGEFSKEATEELIRNTRGAEEISIQGITIDSENREKIFKSTRSSSKKITINGLYYVVGVISENDAVYTVRLEAADTGEQLVASLEDPLIGDRYHKAISSAEWSRKPVRVRITARQVGERIVDAKIVSATRPRNPRQTD